MFTPVNVVLSFSKWKYDKTMKDDEALFPRTGRGGRLGRPGGRNVLQTVRNNYN